MTTYLGLDMGEKRVGVAVSDEMGMIANPLETIQFRGRRQLLTELTRVTGEFRCCSIVVGLPICLDGKHGPAAEKISAHVDWFKKHSAYEWHLWEERLTTKEAMRILDETDLSETRKREVVDRIAAQRILQSYLDAHRSIT